MLNVFLGNISHLLTTSHGTVYGINTDALYWLPILYVGYFHRKKYGVVTRYATQSPKLARIAIG